ncbi:sigma factor-like helix-turn-helix DNA-binding protein [Sphaerisporangium sp. NPDC005289]|uniref:sigma factor-like helix-turn-helix DNA-binding protein n=1 Tax=Sphaerisporangium sp. NPDC005289 TaxID=3155247 RepID=UPI0033A75586
MPGWPSVGRADDQRLVERLRQADSRAADGLYDAYADRLNDYAHSLLRDIDAAADSVHDAIVTAHGRIGVLREPARLRAWLYALTRYQCGTRRGRTPAHGTDTEQYLPGDEEDPELAEIVRESLDELAPKDRDALVLGVRHGLAASDIGAVLGITSRQAGTRLERARDHLENAAAAVVLARSGRAHCPDLSALLDSIEGPLPQQLRRRITRHIIGCKECTEGRRRRVSAERLLDSVPVAFPPLSLRRRVAESCARPRHDEARTAIMTLADGFDKNGFPPAAAAERRLRAERRGGRDERRAAADQAAETPYYGMGVAHAETPRHGMAGEQDGTGVGSGRSGRGPARRRGAPVTRRASRRSTPVFATIACVLVATGAMVVATGQDASHPGGTTPTLRFPSRTPGELQISYGPEPTDEATSAGPSPTSSSRTRPTPTPTLAPQARTSAAAPAATSSSAPPSRTPTPRPPSPAARLVVSCPGAFGGKDAGEILISARNASVSWTAAATGALSVSPASGTLKAGVKQRVSVVVSAPEEDGKGAVTLQSAAGAATCAISWEAQDPPPASDPPPDQQPTSDPSPTETASEQATTEAT